MKEVCTLDGARGKLSFDCVVEYDDHAFLLGSDRGEVPFSGAHFDRIVEFVSFRNLREEIDIEFVDAISGLGMAGSLPLFAERGMPSGLVSLEKWADRTMGAQRSGKILYRSWLDLEEIRAVLLSRKIEVPALNLVTRFLLNTMEFIGSQLGGRCVRILFVLRAEAVTDLRGEV